MCMRTLGLVLTASGVSAAVAALFAALAAALVLAA